ncbi:hypothetical protein J6590_085272 [Homalodisca vitripennis]|nr:hypothetical protein J6590_085272 [Homalodisca vitripennis]
MFNTWHLQRCKGGEEWSLFMHHHHTNTRNTVESSVKYSEEIPRTIHTPIVLSLHSTDKKSSGDRELVRSSNLAAPLLIDPYSVTLSSCLPENFHQDVINHRPSVFRLATLSRCSKIRQEHTAFQPPNVLLDNALHKNK